MIRVPGTIWEDWNRTLSLPFGSQSLQHCSILVVPLEACAVCGNLAETQSHIQNCCLALKEARIWAHYAMNTLRK